MLQETRERQENMSIVYLPGFHQRLIPFLIGATRLDPECRRWVTTSRIVYRLSLKVTDSVADSAWTGQTLICLIYRHHGRIEKPCAREVIYGFAADLTDRDILRRIAQIWFCQMSKRGGPEFVIDCSHELTLAGKRPRTQAKQLAFGSGTYFDSWRLTRVLPCTGASVMIRFKSTEMVFR